LPLKSITSLPCERVDRSDRHHDLGPRAETLHVCERIPITRRRRTIGLYLMLPGGQEIDDGVDAVLRHAALDSEVDVALTEEIDERSDAVRCRRA